MYIRVESFNKFSSTLTGRGSCVPMLARTRVPGADSVITEFQVARRCFGVTAEPTDLSLQAMSELLDSGLIKRLFRGEPPRLPIALSWRALSRSGAT